MTREFHGMTCTLMLFEAPGGEVESVSLVEGVLGASGDDVTFRPEEGGERVRIPRHLIGEIEVVTDEHREVLEEVAGEYCLRAFYDGSIAGGFD